MEFQGLWKLYLLSLLGSTLRDFHIDNESARQVIGALEEAGLIRPGASLSSTIRSALEYVRRALNPESIEAQVHLDPATGIPVSVTGRIALREPTASEREAGSVTADELLIASDRALGEAGVIVWLALDRLDVAFAESPELEVNALRALFRVYMDMMGLRNTSLKIFLRNDIWERITASGFRESSHITRDITITWDEPALLNLIIRRALGNPELRERYHAEPEKILESQERQKRVFYNMFPMQVDAGSRKPGTLKWMLTRTSDGTGETAPRELIHLLEASRGEQLRKLDLGEGEPSDERLFSASALKAGLPEVSRARLEQTLYAEYPQCKDTIGRLEGQKTQQNIASLTKIWGLDDEATRAMASKLVEIGFFEQQGPPADPTYWVPFLYRDALRMVQGAAD